MSEFFDQSKLRQMLMGQVNKQSVVELWKGGRRIWPDDSARSNAIRLQLPEYGTLEWAYWQHAIDAVSTLGASETCYLRLEFGGKYYYLIDSPDGSVPLKLEGGMAYYEAGQSFPTDGLGDTVTAVALVPERIEGYPSDKWMYLMNMDGGVYQEKVEDSDIPGMPDGCGRDRYKGFLPVIPNTVFHSVTSKGQKNSGVRSWYEVRNLPDESLVCKELTTHAGGRGDFEERHALTEKTSGDSPDGSDPWNYWFNNQNNTYHDGANGFTLTMMYHGGGACQFGLNIVWPHFSRRWNLPVINVNTAG